MFYVQFIKFVSSTTRVSASTELNGEPMAMPLDWTNVSTFFLLFSKKSKMHIFCTYVFLLSDISWLLKSLSQQKVSSI